MKLLLSIIVILIALALMAKLIHNPNALAERHEKEMEKFMKAEHVRHEIDSIQFRIMMDVLSK